MRKRDVAALLAVAIFILVIGTPRHRGLLLEAIQHPPGERPALQAQLLSASMRVGVGGTIDLAVMVDGNWQWVHLFGGHTSYEAVDQELGFEWTPLSWLDRALGLDESIDESDELLVFTKDQSVVAWAVVDTYARPGVVFDGVIGPLFRGQAQLSVSEEDAGPQGRGSSWILRPAGA